MKNSLLQKTDYVHYLDVVRQHEFYVVPIGYAIPLEQTLNLILKRAFDVIVSFLLLTFLFSWMLPLVGLLIKIDSRGPVLFFQKRNKKNSIPFTCIKFRTMIANSDADTMAARENDSRITRIGMFLRKHHLDELPQLINVLLGDMSLIGPRPYMISENEKYEQLIKNYSVRHKVKPGITGLAQVIDYVNPITKVENMERRVNKDAYYVYNWSFMLDLKILVRTFFKMTGVK